MLFFELRRGFRSSNVVDQVPATNVRDSRPSTSALWRLTPDFCLAFLARASAWHVRLHAPNLTGFSTNDDDAAPTFSFTDREHPTRCPLFNKATPFQYLRQEHDGADIYRRSYSRATLISRFSASTYQPIYTQTTVLFCILAGAAGVALLLRYRLDALFTLIY